MKSNVIKLVKDAMPVRSNESARCWFFHKWGKWVLLNKAEQARQCVKCDFIVKRHIW